MSNPHVIAAALGSMVFFAAATALKHRSATKLPPVRRSHPGDLLRFVTATAQHPLWLAGLLADVGGLSLQVLALHIGALAVVQPVLATSLILAIIVNHWIAGTRPSRKELALGVILVASIAGFLTVSGAVTAGAHSQAVDKVPAAAAAATAIVVAGGCILAARRLPSGTAAALMGVAVGTTYAATAALIKACTNVAAGHGYLALLSSWQLYILIGAGLLGLVLAQLAFQAGPLTASLPATATTDPLLSITLGVVVYDEHLHSQPLAILAQLFTLLLMSASVVQLTRIRTNTTPERGSPRRQAPLAPTEATK